MLAKHDVCAPATPEQGALRAAALELARLIRLHVPPSTIHWVIEDARRAANLLARHAHTVTTRDVCGTAADTASSVSCQHRVDTGHYLYVDGSCPCDEVTR